MAKRVIRLLPAFLLLFGGAADAQVRSGSYLGNGVARSITGLGFQPDVVIVRGNDNAYRAIISTSTMGGLSKGMTSATSNPAVFGLITSLDADGFSLSNAVDVNKPNIPYHWIAFRAVAGELKVGTYPSCCGSDDRNITGIGFMPAYVVVIPEAARSVYQRSSAMLGDLSFDFDNSSGDADTIQALLADGFQVGADPDVNGDGPYHYVAWKAVPGKMAVGSYTGDGADKRAVPGAGFLPEYVIVKRQGASGCTHKPASMGPAVDQSMLFNLSNFQVDAIQAFQADGFQVGTQPRVNQSGDTFYWMAFGPHPLQTNYRSIGTAPDDTTGTLTATNGSPDLTGAGTSWMTNNRGRGDVITICDDPPACTSNSNYVVDDVGSNTSLRLKTAYTGPSGALKTFSVRRQFGNVQAWESCVSFGAACPFFPVASPSLVNDRREEIGYAYKESVFTGGLVIDGAITDAAHTITLTTPPRNRHHGVAGAGVVVNNGASASPAIQILDDFITVEWLEVANGATTADAILVNNLTASLNSVVIQDLLIHNGPRDGIRIASADAIVDAYDNIVYRNGGRGIYVSTALNAASQVRLWNNTVYSNAGPFGIVAQGISFPTVLLQNNISNGNTGGDFSVPGRNTASSNNLASDTTGTTHSPALGGINSATATASPTSCPSGTCVGFVNITAGSENLHLIATTYTNRAINAGANLSALVAPLDIDAQGRVAPWDIGADELTSANLGITKADGGTTAVPGNSVPGSYTITATNSGPDAVTGATVTDILPASLTGASWTCAASAGSSCTAAGSGNILDTVNLLVGGTATYNLSAGIDPFARGTLLNTATVSPPPGVTDPDGSNNSASDTDTLTPSVDVSVLKADATDPVPLGELLNYTLTVSNGGLSGATNVSLQDPLPASMNLDSAPTTTHGSCSYDGPSRTVDCTLGDLDPAEVATVTIKVRPQALGSFINTATTSRTETDSNLVNDSDSETTQVILSTLGVQAFTATSKNQRNVLTWVNPAADYASTEIRWSNVGFPASVTDGNPLYNNNDGGAGGRWSIAHDTPPLTNGQTYYYAAFVHHLSGPPPSPGRFVTGRPFDHTTGPVKWAFSTGTTALTPPTVGGAGVIATSNDHMLYAMQRGTDDDLIPPDGGEWPTGFEPANVGGPVQSRSPVVPVDVGGANPVVFAGSQDGNVYAIDAIQGGVAPALWVKSLAVPPASLQAAVQAAPAGIFSDFAGTLDYILVGTYDTSASNIFFALDPQTGAEVARYDTGNIGIVSGMAAVDYGPPLPRRVYFTSYAGGTGDTLWCFNLNEPPPPEWSLRWPRALGNIASSPVLRGGRVYVGNSSTVYSIDAMTGGGDRTFVHNNGQVKGFVFPDRASPTGDIYFATDDFVWGVSDTGAATMPVKFGGPISLPGAKPSPVVFVPGSHYLYVGGSDGKLYEIDTLQASPVPNSVTLGDGLAVVGAPSLDREYDLIHVGTEAGIFYAVQIPLPPACVPAAACTTLNAGQHCYISSQAECATKACTGVPGQCQ